MFFKLFLVLLIVPIVSSRGLLLLYRPKDVSNDCVLSHKLRYDISFGMGMSDTITLVLRNIKEIDYECVVEIVTDTDSSLLIVIHFPNPIDTNCATNRNAFTILKKNKCLGICDLMQHDRDAESQLFIISVKSRVRFRFISNSSINSDMDAIKFTQYLVSSAYLIAYEHGKYNRYEKKLNAANVYQVTATAARKQPPTGCNFKNETMCGIDHDQYCITSGVVCDGIMNCGVTDWYDERKSDCLAPSEFIGYAPVVAVVAVILCLLLVASHFMLRYLPMSANSFFIFNANEDNRLCIDPVFMAPDTSPNEIEKPKRISLIPVSSSSSDEHPQQVLDNKIDEPDMKSKVFETPISFVNPPEQAISKEEKSTRRKTTMRTMTDMLQQRLRSVTSRVRNANPTTEDYVG